MKQLEFVLVLTRFIFKMKSVAIRSLVCWIRIIRTYIIILKARPLTSSRLLAREGYDLIIAHNQVSN